VAIGNSAGASGQGANAVAIGSYAATIGQQNDAISVGNMAGSTGQGNSSVAIGASAGASGQGQYSIAIGTVAATTNQPSNSIVLSAGAVGLSPSTAGFFVQPVNAGATAADPWRNLYYNTTTSEIATSPTLPVYPSSLAQYTATGAGVSGGFISTGAGGDVVLNDGTFVTNIPTTSIPGGASALLIQNGSAVPRWNIGLAGSETGGNVGADFVINNYNDAGSFVGAPIQITRSTGVVTATGLVSSNLGLNAMSLGPISPGGMIPPGITPYPIGTFTPTKTGVHIFNASFLMVVGADTAAPTLGGCLIGGSDSVSVAILGTGVNVSVNMKPWSMNATTSSPAGVGYTINSSVLAILTAGQLYTVSGYAVNVSNIMYFPDRVGPGLGGYAQFAATVSALC